MEMLVREGHAVFLLTTCETGELHRLVESTGVVVEEPRPAARGRLVFYAQQLSRLHEVVEAREIEVVIAHQQVAAFLAGLCRLSRKFVLFYVRHNSDEDYIKHPVKAALLNLLANRSTNLKVAPSDVVKRFWVQSELEPRKAILRINYGYNFQMYEAPEPNRVAAIRKQYPAALLIVSVARLVPSKRHFAMFEVVERLVRAGVDAKLLCLGDGVLMRSLQEAVEAAGLGSRIFLLGRKASVIDYIAASDVVLHLSITEASNSAVKEAALCRRPSIVCREVGDFEDYVFHAQTGFLVPKDLPVEATVSVLKSATLSTLRAMGAAAHDFVVMHFSIQAVKDQYSELLRRACRKPAIN
jgi:glycosyltransferase involved in cell wall biosynthesis